MGWQANSRQFHEGYIGLVLADGRVSGGSTKGGVLVHELHPDDIVEGREVKTDLNGELLWVVVPRDQVTTWRVVCSCGWSGIERPAEWDPVYGDNDPDDGVRDEWAFPDWKAHVAPLEALNDLEELTEELSTFQARVEARMEAKVALARSGGASWTEIGRATGLSKQGAQQRWGNTTTDAATA